MTASTLAPRPSYDLADVPSHLAEARRQVRPSREQLRVAAAMFAAAPEDVTSVVVPVVVPGTALRSEHPGGYWLADRSAREGHYAFSAACDAARDVATGHLRSRGRQGVAGWVSIRPDGSWAAFGTVLPGQEAAAS